LEVGRWRSAFSTLDARFALHALEILGASSAGILVVAFSLILLWHNPLIFWNDDYELSVLPVFADVARSWSRGIGLS